MGVQNDPFYMTMLKGAQARADELNVSLVATAPAQFDPAPQIPLVESMMARQVDAILIAACDKDAMIEPLKRAYDAGIKIISVDTYIGNGDYTHGPVTFPLSYIGSDNVQGGRIAGSALIKAIGGRGKIYIQNVKPGISTIIQREQGCLEAIQATGGAVTLTGVDYNNDSSVIARQQTAAVLRRVQDLSAIFGANLFSAEGAAHAVKDAGKQGVIKVASFDAPKQAIIDLRNGVIDIVIAQLPAQMGRIAIEYAVKALSGETGSLKKRVTTGYVIIDKDNVDTPEAQAAIYTSK
jgi:ribose transport system substrate-binding protein